MKNKYIAWFNEVGRGDIGIVGGKGANLGEMVRAGIPVPFGFVVTAQAYFEFIKETKLFTIIRKQLDALNVKDSRQLQQVSAVVRHEIIRARMPEEIAQEIIKAYLDLPNRAGSKQTLIKKLASYLTHPVVAVRSSATAEDLPDASFAGQQATFLNVQGEANVVKKVQEAWASLFTARAIFYREEQKYDHFKVGIAVPVQLMVNSTASGVMFTVDPVTTDKTRVVVEAVLGLGELIVQGAVTPDHFEVDKKSRKLLTKKISYQNRMMVKKDGGNKIIALSKDAGSKQKVTDDLVLKVADVGCQLEKHYFFPQDVEWAIEDGHVYIVQTRPITTLKKAEASAAVKPSVVLSDKKDLILQGDPASPGISWGPPKVIYHVSEIDQVKEGDVLVTMQTNPDFVPAMKRAVAIVTERGGRTSHAAIVSRELGIPAVVGAAGATKAVKSLPAVTVDGGKGQVYKGAPPMKFSHILSTAREATRGATLKTATKVYVNMASPTRAAEAATYNVDGVGLLRAEFMIADIGVHPRKLIREHKEHVFIDKLSADLLTFCKAFSPRPVVYRATDFKTNEYRNLKGGAEFEPEEPNPMLGFRGAYRYMSDPAVFNLELETIKRIRNKEGFTNLWLMLPFVRTVHELAEVKKLVAKSGLSRSPSFKLWMMVEIPSNVILLDDFCKEGIDGVSIGSNDLTMLILGTDRDNTEVAPEFDERNPAVTWAIEKVVKTCNKYGVTSSICGQAPSDYPELVEKLVEWGITSMSVNVDAVDHVRETVYDLEQKMHIKKK
jgi:pyruvate, water dikinase